MGITRACASPRRVGLKARAAARLAANMSERAWRFSPATTAVRSDLAMSSIARMESASEIGCVVLFTYDSRAWARASIPVDAVMLGGKVSVSTGSHIAMVAVM